MNFHCVPEDVGMVQCVWFKIFLEKVAKDFAQGEGPYSGQATLNKLLNLSNPFMSSDTTK